MALNKVLTFTGPSVVNTPMGQIRGEEQSVSIDCYIKAHAVSSTKDNAVVYVYYFDKKAPVDQSTPQMPVFSKEFQFKLDLEGGNPISQAYSYLKALPEFEGSMDC